MLILGDNSIKKYVIVITGAVILFIVIFTFIFHDVAMGIYGTSVILIGIASLMFMIIDPFWGLLLIIITNQFDSYVHLPVSITVGRLVGIFVAIGWLFKYFFRKKTLFFQLAEFNYITLLFIVSIIFSSLLATYPSASLKMAITISLLILMVFFMQDFITTEKKLNLFLITIAFSIGISSLVGIIQYQALLSGSHAVGDVEFEGIEKTARFAGFLGNSNNYGLMMMSGIPLLLFFSLNASNRILKIVSVIFFFTTLISMGLSLSRTSIFSFIMFISSFIFLKFKYNYITKKNLCVLLLILIIITLTFYFFLYDIMKARDFSLEDNSSEIRRMIMNKAFKLLTEHPLFGIGFGNFENYYRFDEHYGNISGRPGHDIVSMVFASTGMVGTLVFTFLCYKTLTYYLIAIKKLIKTNNRYWANLSITLISATIALLFSGFGGPVIVQRIFWIYIALAEIMRRWSSLRFMNS
jgi:O-antigen ligase